MAKLGQNLLQRLWLSAGLQDLRSGSNIQYQEQEIQNNYKEQASSINELTCKPQFQDIKSTLLRFHFSNDYDYTIPDIGIQVKAVTASLGSLVKHHQYTQQGCWSPNTAV